MSMIFFDMDGTLVDDNSMLSLANQEAIRKAHVAGYRLAIATGRPVSTVEKYIAKWGMEGMFSFIVGMNGSHMKNLQTGEFHENLYIPSDATEEIISLFEQVPCEIALFDEQHVYSPEPTEYVQWYVDADKLTYVQTDLRKERHQSWPKIAIITDPDKQQVVIEQNKLFSHTQAVGHVASRFTIEFTHVSINKGKGIEKMCEWMGYDVHDTIAIGDSNNDLSMFAVCGTSVCMASGTERAKEMADVITGTIEEDGVAQYLNQLLKKHSSCITDGLYIR